MKLILAACIFEVLYASLKVSLHLAIVFYNHLKPGDIYMYLRVFFNILISHSFYVHALAKRTFAMFEVVTDVLK
jgi:hypothetical protein